MPRTSHFLQRFPHDCLASPTRALKAIDSADTMVGDNGNNDRHTIDSSMMTGENRPNRRLLFSCKVDGHRAPQFELAALHSDQIFLEKIGLDEDPFWSPPVSPTNCPATFNLTNDVNELMASQQDKASSADTDAAVYEQSFEDVFSDNHRTVSNRRARSTYRDSISFAENLGWPCSTHKPSPRFEYEEIVADDVVFGDVELWDEDTKACISPSGAEQTFIDDNTVHGRPQSVPNWVSFVPQYFETFSDVSLDGCSDDEAGVTVNSTFHDQLSDDCAWDYVSPGSSDLEANSNNRYTAPLATALVPLIHFETSSEIGDEEHNEIVEALIGSATGTPLSNLEALATLVSTNSLSDDIKAPVFLDQDVTIKEERFFCRETPNSTSFPGKLMANKSKIGTSIVNPGRLQVRYKTSSGISEFENYDIAASIKQTAPAPQDMMGRTVKKQSVSSDHHMAIFIHAGAGYHSIQNEHVHLAMCAMAASEAMQVLKSGGTAVDAVVAAIRILEDQEIANAGYGSNLTIDGKVECDATIVDHFGRSGACGAVSQIKNPISLAKLILSTSTQTLSLRRVPPNLLVGEGAMLFAKEHGMATVKNSALVSRNANDRYQKWRADLARGGPSFGAGAPLTPPGKDDCTAGTKDRSQDQDADQWKPATRAQKSLLRDHSSALLLGTWNEGQPNSPDSDSHGITVSDEPTSPTKTHSPLSGSSNISKRKQPATPACMSDGSLTSSCIKRAKSLKDEETCIADGFEKVISLDGSCGGHDITRLDSKGSSFQSPPNGPSTGLNVTELTAEPVEDEYDLITDTIGAIAIDYLGNIAAGSSSGGIGMKHMGRTGPAALVGVGTAVIPCDRGDPEKKRTAAVTSGTGEHMATTMAAQKCAERLYHCTRRGSDGRDVRDYDTCAVMKSFVMNDFMAHPGVCNMPNARAIGVMGVEVTISGIYFHWAHNTDSFALASMGEGDYEPAVVMSRLAEGQNVTVGARKVSTARDRS